LIFPLVESIVKFGIVAPKRILKRLFSQLFFQSRQETAHLALVTIEQLLRMTKLFVHSIVSATSETASKSATRMTWIEQQLTVVISIQYIIPLHHIFDEGNYLSKSDFQFNSTDKPVEIV
jgi:hypothetical protein